MERLILNNENQNLGDVAKNNKLSYDTALPFPNITFANFFNGNFLKEVLDEFPDLSKVNSIKYDNFNERKLAGIGEANFGVKTKQLLHYLNSEPFLIFLQNLTGIKETLMPDPYFIGGGLHEIKSGGLLKIHADFNKHKFTKLDRRLNLLIYLNEDWSDDFGGHFELWDKQMAHCVKKVSPIFNTMALFSTTDFSYHGLPNPLTCPPNRSRKSLALYYYSNGRPIEEINSGLEEHSTLFKARSNHPDDEMPKDLIIKKILRNIIPPIFYKIAEKLK